MVWKRRIICLLVVWLAVAT